MWLMPKARNMIIDGYRKGVQLQIDKWGMFYIFNGRNPIDSCDIVSHQLLSEETTKNVTSTVGRGLLGSALFGFAGTSAALTGKEDKIYTIKVIWDDYKKGISREPSVFELDSEFYKMFMMKCVRTPEEQKLFEDADLTQKLGVIQQTQPITNNTSDIKSKLQQLKSMYEEELITEDEYNAKKQELLSQM